MINLKNNKIKLLLLILLFSLSVVLATIIILKVNNKKNIDILCERKSIKVNEELKCKIIGKISKYEVSNISTKIKLSNGVTLKKIDPDPSWQGDGYNGIIELYTDKNKKRKFNIATFSIITNNNKNIKIELTNTFFYDQNFEKHKIENITKKIKVTNGGK